MKAECYNEVDGKRCVWRGDIRELRYGGRCPLCGSTSTVASDEGERDHDLYRHKQHRYISDKSRSR